MDEVSAIAVAYVAKDGVEKLLGPTFEYLGVGLKNTIEKFNVGAKENINKIFKKAIDKKKEKIDETGKVSPRIIKDIVLDGSFCDTNVLQEYYSGILAASRTINGDDSDVFYLNIIKGLSTEQLKLHYVIYCKFLQTYKGQDVNLHESIEISKRTVNFMLGDILKIFKFKDGNSFSDFTSHTIPALYNVGLLKNYSFDVERKSDQFSFTISLVGLSLFLRALGYSEIFTPACLNDVLLDEAMKNIVDLNEL